jgi:hypothetical protein
MHGRLHRPLSTHDADEENNSREDWHGDTANGVVEHGCNTMYKVNQRLTW